MTDSTVTGALERCRVLVVEDEYLIADDMAQAPQRPGAEGAGPVPGREQARALIAANERLDAAVLDFNLRGESVLPVAEALAGRGVPFVFATGYDQDAVP